LNFFDFSHAFRKGHSQHEALHGLREKCRKLNIGRIVSADIEGLLTTLIIIGLTGMDWPFIRRKRRVSSAEKAWRFWLSRRSHKGGISWANLRLPSLKSKIIGAKLIRDI
jgi:hypothetical protein